MGELDKLIQAQAADQRRGSRVNREPIVALSLDAFDEQPAIGKLYARPRECSLHGGAEVRWTPSGWWWCRACHRSYSRAHRRANGAQPRGIGPRCALELRTGALCARKRGHPGRHHSVLYQRNKEAPPA